MSKAVKKWSPEEDEILLQQVTLLSSQGKSKDWTAIASAIPGRSNKDCRKRWCNHLVGGLRKGPWDPGEDRRLAIGVKEYGLQWPLVAEEVGTRSADQCSKRWQHSLNPSLDRSKWTEEEEERLLKAVEMHGRAWKQIQMEHFPGRATNNVKNKYAVLTRKRDCQSSDNDGQDAASSSGEYGPGERTAPTSPAPTTTRTSDDEVSSLIRDDPMIVGNDYTAQQHGDPFSLDMYAHAMDLDITAAYPFATDLSLDLGGTSLLPDADEQVNDALFTPDHGRCFSTAPQTDTHTGSQFDSEMDPRSMWTTMDLLHKQPAKLVLTIENPSPEAITGIMGVLVPCKTKFRMEMK